MSHYYVYIMCNKRRGTLYVGSTSNLVKRVWEHKSHVNHDFTKKYCIDKLAYYEVHHTYGEAARREKRFKSWCRQWKINLIESMNPLWRDLYEEICG